jgi:thioredoxin-like negative regulator of GroEL
MELFEQARKLLEMAPSTLAVDWLYLDVLLKCRRYAEGLDALLTLERRYANDPETTFAATYARAQALAGLGQVGAAAALLKSLVSIRPGYRSAHSLLLQWGGRT